MTIDIIIPTLRSAEEVAPLAAEIIATAGLPCRVIPTCQPLSAAANRNFGLDRSQSDPLIMVDDDMERFPAGWAARLVQVLTDYPRCVMVSAQLARPQGGAGFMMGGVQVRTEGASEARDRRLPTACIAIRRNGLRFDVGFIGSGFEDNDYCAQLCAAFPGATFLVCHDVWIVHRNEQKNQREPYWSRNKALFEKKWGCGQ